MTFHYPQSEIQPCYWLTGSWMSDLWVPLRLTFHASLPCSLPPLLAPPGIFRNPFLLLGAGPPGLDCSCYSCLTSEASITTTFSTASTLLQHTHFPPVYLLLQHVSHSVTVFICLIFQWHGPVLESLLSLLHYCFCFYVLLSWPRGIRDFSPQPGTEPVPPALEGEVLTTGPPEKSLPYD